MSFKSFGTGCHREKAPICQVKINAKFYCCLTFFFKSILMDNGTLKNADCQKEPNGTTRTAMGVAVMKGAYDIVAYLCTKGKNTMSSLMACDEKNLSSGITRSALGVALAFGNFDMIIFLGKNGWDINAFCVRDKEGNSRLFLTSFMF